jgi:hypothetical protein
MLGWAKLGKNLFIPTNPDKKIFYLPMRSGDHETGAEGLKKQTQNGVMFENQTSVSRVWAGLWYDRTFFRPAIFCCRRMEFNRTFEFP